MNEQSGGGIKSAYERAMERIANLEGPTKEKKLEWKGVPEGTAHAVKYLKGEGDLAAALKGYDKDLQRFVLRGMVDVLVGNIAIPKTVAQQQGLDRVLGGLRALYRGNRKAEEVLSRIQYVCDQYKNFGNQQRQQVYEDLKRQFTLQVQEGLRRQGLSQQGPVNVEALPEFQQEWGRIRVQLDGQYEEHLEAFRKELRTLAGASV
jgi:hypothetical protein